MSSPPSRRLRPPSPIRFSPSEESNASQSPAPFPMDVPMSPLPGATESSWRGLGRGIRSHFPHGSPESVDSLVLPICLSRINFTNGPPPPPTCRLPGPLALPPVRMSSAEPLAETPAENPEPVTTRLFHSPHGLGLAPSSPTPETPRVYHPRFIDFERMVGIHGTGRQPSSHRHRRSRVCSGPIGLVQNMLVTPMTPASPDAYFMSPVNDTAVLGTVSPLERPMSPLFSEPPAFSLSHAATPAPSPMPPSPPITRAKFNKRLLAEAEEIEKEDHKLDMARINSIPEARKTLSQNHHSSPPAVDASHIEAPPDPPTPTNPAKRKRGRARKTPVVVDPAAAPATPTAAPSTAPAKRGRGRPRGSKNRQHAGRGRAPAAGYTRPVEAPAGPVPIE
ncbi:hypothetical protein GGX14DRAFT_409246, partial [Mycena pura]